MFKKIFLEGALAIFPGIQRVLPVFVLPLAVDDAVAASILQNLSLATVLVLLTAIGFINAIISESQPERLTRLRKLYALKISILLSLTVIFHITPSGFSDIYYYLILWTFLWGGYQLLRSYLIASDGKRVLIFLEVISMLSLIATIVYFLLSAVDPVYIFVVGLLPFNVYLFSLTCTSFLSINKRKSAKGFLRDSLVFGYANIASAAPMLLLPFLFGLTGVDHRATVIVGLTVNILSVSMLVNRAMSNHYLPKMLNSPSCSALRLYLEFQRINKASLFFVCPFILAIVHFGLTSYYADLYDPSDIILVLSCVLAFFLSQLSLPMSNIMVVMKKATGLATSNTAGLIGFSLVSLGSLMGGAVEKGFLIALIASAFIKYITLKIFVRKFSNA